MSQTALAELLGLDQTGVGKLERGERMLTVQRLMTIEDALDLERGALLFEAGLVPALNSVEAAVLADRSLTPDWARSVLAVYRSAIADAASPAKAANATKSRRS